MIADELGIQLSSVAGLTKKLYQTLEVHNSAELGAKIWLGETHQNLRRAGQQATKPDPKRSSRLRIASQTGPASRRILAHRRAVGGRRKSLHVAGKNLPDRLHQLGLRDAELGFGAQFEIVGAVLGGGGEFGAEDEIADRHLRAIFVIALVRALDDGADRAALVGIFELRVHAGLPEVEFGADLLRAKACDKTLVAGELILVEHEDDDGARAAAAPRRSAS